MSRSTRSKRKTPGQPSFLMERSRRKGKVDLSFRVGGPLVKLPVKEGDYISKGSLIAAIDQRDYTIQLESSEARLLQAEGEYKRYQQLFEKEKIPANTYEKIKAQYLLTKSGFENAQHQLKDTELRAPVSGYIFNKHVENHQTVGSGQPIVSIIDKSMLEVIVHVPENQVAGITRGKEFLLNIASANVHNAPVTLLNIAEKAGDNGLYEVKFAYKSNNGAEVYPGMTAEISMHFQHENSSITIPVNAIFRDGEVNYVWLYNPSDARVSKRKVMISSIQSDGKIGITTGLSVGESIVSAGVHFLQDNQTVKTVKEPSSTNVGGLL